jgi:hypothetical protein
VRHIVNLFYSSLSLIINTLACHVIKDLTPSLSKELLGDNLREALKKLTFSLIKASTECIILLYVSLYNIYFIFMIVHLYVRVVESRS